LTRPNPRSGHAPINGASIYYEARGSGPAVVLIPGFSLDTTMWDDQTDEFSRNHTLVRYDVRGFGRSSVPDQPYSNADDLRSLLDYLGIGRAAVCGLSMGGTIAIEFALRYPERTWALVPVDAAGGTLVDQRDSIARQHVAQLNAMGQSVRRVALDKGIPAAKHVWLESMVFDGERSFPAVQARLRKIVEGYSGYHWVNSPPYLPFKPDPVEQYGALRTPTLVVLGDLDFPLCHTVAKQLEAGVQGARLHTIRGAGHMSNMDAPDEFNRVVLEFLQQAAQGLAGGT
jgi:pimeloyl-ACP methyl ester carboxylesterase